MSQRATCRVCGKAFGYGGRSAAPSACPSHIEEWHARVTELIDGCRPWQDAEATTDALLAVLPHGTAPELARLTADAMRQLPAQVDGAVAVAITGELFRGFAAGRSEPLRGRKRAQSVTAHELMRFGVPYGTAYRKAREGMSPAEAVPYALRRVARLLDTSRRMNQGAIRATARKGAARRFPRPSGVPPSTHRALGE